MQLAYPLKPEQKAAELIFPAEHPLNRIEPFLEYGRVEASKSGLRPRLGVFLPRGLALMLGIIPRLKMALRFFRQS